VLDRGSAIPLYYQIQQYLLSQIRAGVYRPGQAIPSEQEICEQFHVSRMTTRQALRALCDRGIIYSRRGLGTYVSAAKLEKDFRQVLSFTEEMKARGSSSASTVLSFEVIPAEPSVADALRLNSGDQVISLRRVRIADGAPLGSEHSRLPLALCPDLLKRFNPHTSLYQTLSTRYGVHIAVTDEVAEAGLARADEARLLEIPPRSPVFLLTRHSYDKDGVPVEYVTSVYRGDRYRIANRLTARPHG
jgi:GntR family transcriptional regulator